jgi:hypothetical protein
MKTPVRMLIFTLMTLSLAACRPGTTVSKTPVLSDTLSYITARRLVQNYNGRAHIIKNGRDNKGLNLPDTRCVWFSLEQLKALVGSIDKEHGDGVRFYLAAYDSVKKPDIEKIKDAYLNYTTLIMVSTKLDSALKIHTDYYPGVNGKQGGTITAPPANQGELCPPPATCISSGATLLDN